MNIGDCYFYLLLFLGCCKWYDMVERTQLEILGLKKESDVFWKTVTI